MTARTVYAAEDTRVNFLFCVFVLFGLPQDDTCSSGQVEI